jgi:hypothetical protein
MTDEQGYLYAHAWKNDVQYQQRERWMSDGLSIITYATYTPA